jgi:hypothetical protein
MGFLAALARILIRAGRRVIEEKKRLNRLRAEHAKVWRPM